MEFRPLGRTDLNVSSLCLGTMTWGEQNTEADAFAQIEMAKAAGINFIDTAEMYPVPPRPETYATTEQYWQLLQPPRRSSRLDTATKIAGPGNGISHIRNGRPRFNREHIRTALDDSLRRLQTDWIDLYQLHCRNAARTFRAFGLPAPAGRRFHTSGRNACRPMTKSEPVESATLAFPTRPLGAMKYLQLAETHKWPRAVSIQNPYNLLNRSFEGLAEISM